MLAIVNIAKSTKFAYTGPIFVSKSIVFALYVWVPIISLGNKSGVHCILENLPPQHSVNTLAAVVFARPGTDSTKICPFAINDISKEMNIPMSMSNLERIKVGNFDIKDSNELDDEEYKYYHIEDIFDYPVYKLNDREYFRVKNGVSLLSDNYGDIVLFKYNGEEIAIYKKENNMMKVLLMLKWYYLQN